jgi:hypothetical protein
MEIEARPFHESAQGKRNSALHVTRISTAAGVAREQHCLAAETGPSGSASSRGKPPFLNKNSLAQ